MSSVLAKAAFPLDGFATRYLPRRALMTVAIEVERASREHSRLWPELGAKLHDRALELRKQAEAA